MTREGGRPADNAIRNAEEDSLERREFCTRLVRTLEEMDLSEGVITALTGAWGAGKTSCLNMIAEILETEGRQVVRFDAGRWEAGGELPAKVLGAIGAALGVPSEQAGHGETGDPGDDLLRYVALAFAWEPTTTSVATGARGVRGLWRQWRDRRKSWNVPATPRGAGGPAEEHWRKIVQTIRQRPTPVWVLIDDLDRLDKAQIRGVLNAVKMAGNIPQVVYLVACDRTAVAAAVAGNGWNGHSYLEKILSREFTVPEMSWDDRRRWMDRNIDAATGDHLEARKRLLQEVGEGGTLRTAERLMKTPRDFKRYGMAIRQSLEGLGEHAKVLCMTDLFLLEAVRLKAPDAMEVLRRRKADFTAHLEAEVRSVLANDEPDERATEAAEEFMAAWPEGKRVDAKAFLDECFPRVQLAGKTGDTQSRAQISVDRGRIWRRQGRIAVQLLLDLALGGRMTRELENAILAADIVGALADRGKLRELLKPIDVERGGEIMEEVEPETGFCGSEEALAAIPVLVDKRVDASRRSTRPLDSGTENKYRRVVARLLEKIPEASLASQLGTIVSETGTLGGQASLLGLVEHEKTAGRISISEEDFAALREGWFKRVVHCPEPPADSDAFRLARLAVETGETLGQSWVPPGTPAFTLRLIEGARGAVISQTGAASSTPDRMRMRQVVTPQLDWEGLCRVLGGEREVGVRLRQLEGSTALAGANREQQEAYELAWDYWAGRTDEPFTDGPGRQEIRFSAGEDVRRKTDEVRREGETDRDIWEMALHRGHMDDSVGATRGLVAGKPKYSHPHEVRARISPAQREHAERLATGIGVSLDEVWLTTLGAGLDRLRQERGSNGPAPDLGDSVTN